MEKNTYLSVEEAVQLLLENTHPQGEAEARSLLDAVGRIAAEDIFAGINQPPFDRSPLDGYAINHKDLESARANSPAILRVVSRIYAGDAPQMPIAPGEAAMIMTGAPMPLGTDCVVRQEDTDRGEDRVAIYKSLGEYENYCWRGEDVKEGQQLVKAGKQLDSADIAVMAGQGYTEVKVFCPPTIGVLSTGSELIALGNPLSAGKIYDSNSYYLAARLSLLGGQVIFGGKVEDNPQSITLAIKDLMQKCDIIITTGGVSVGAHDYMPAVGEMLGAKQLFHGVEMKPGTPALALSLNKKLILALSGNPFAVAATFEMLARPVIETLSGNTNSNAKRMTAVLRDSFEKKSPSRRFVRATIIGNEVYLSKDGHSSGTLASMSGCNCLIDIPAGTQKLWAGATVNIVLI